ncbi:MAG: hypothetical protein Q4D11_00295 [Rhodospirillales bacterium]|nr:hypothetical protein [Rhodospirillales bacterium]
MSTSIASAMAYKTAMDGFLCPFSIAERYERSIPTWTHNSICGIFLVLRIRVKYFWAWEKI